MSFQKVANGQNVPLAKSEETKLPLKSSRHNVNLKTQGFAIGERLKLDIMSKLIRSEKSGHNVNSKTQDDIAEELDMSKMTYKPL